ncbi:hypothetical protein [Roseibium sp.]|uniref:hypothetical protein n=1 Tax=Roseibium sp. TaxID=1936156 RepID=UPI003D10EA9C
MTEHGADSRPKRLRYIYYCATVMKWVMNLFVAVFLVLAVNIAVSFLVPGYVPFGGEETITVGSTDRVIADLQFNQRAAFTVWFVVSASLQLGLILSLRRLFCQFQKSEFFVQRTLQAVIALGVWFISVAVFEIASDPLTTLLASLDYPQEQWVLDIALDGTEVIFMILGAFMLLFGWILREAAVLAEENRQII